MSERNGKTTPSNIVAHIPELLQYILDDLDDSELVVLLRVSRHFFRYAAPLLWDDVNGVHQLMVLVPREVLKTKNTRLNDSNIYAVKALTTLDRFNVYAPLVKSFHIFESDSFVFRLTRCEKIAKFDTDISSFIYTQQPIFPNLVSLHCESGLMSRIEEISHLTRMLLHNSLRDVQIYAPLREFSNTSNWLAPSLAHNLLLGASQQCPKLKTLYILPEKPQNTVGDAAGEIEYTSLARGYLRISHALALAGANQ